MCLEGGTWLPIRQLASACPVTCGCRAGDPNCPLSCPARNASTPPCADYQKIYADPVRDPTHSTCPLGVDTRGAFGGG